VAKSKRQFSRGVAGGAKEATQRAADQARLASVTGRTFAEAAALFAGDTGDPIPTRLEPRRSGVAVQQRAAEAGAQETRAPVKIGLRGRRRASNLAVSGDLVAERGTSAGG
jgi:hypothetical protein